MSANLYENPAVLQIGKSDAVAYLWKNTVIFLNKSTVIMLPVVCRSTMPDSDFEYGGKLATR